MDKKPVLLDGGSGTLLWSYAEEAGIPKDPVWTYNIRHPELVTRLHLAYLEAGSELIFANMFSLNGPAVERYSDRTVQEEVQAAIRLAKDAVRLSGKKAKVAADIGPLTALLEPYGKCKKEECASVYREIVRAALSEKPDYFVFETFMDLEMMRIAVTALMEELAALMEGHPDEINLAPIPVICSMTFEKRHRTMMGDSVDKNIRVLSELGVSAVGMNCSYGPEEAVAIIRDFREKTDLPLIVKPNAGMNGRVFDPEEYAEKLSPVFEMVSYVGGCCGTDPAYIRAIRDRMR